MSTERRSKKRKIRSVCSGIELASAFHVLQNNLESAELDVEIDKDTLAQLDGILQWINSKSRAFSSANDIQPEIIAGRPLSLKSDVTQRIAAARLAGGADHFMSYSNMHEYLYMLLRLVARPSEASSRTWADAFLYRASAMLLPTKQISLASFCTGSEVILVGLIDYTVVVTNDQTVARCFLNHPGRNLAQPIESVLGFFVVEAAKEQGVTLNDHVTQVLTQLYATAKKLKKYHIRGTLTNGYGWLFLVLNVNPNGKGASYRISDRSYSTAPQEVGVGDMIVPDMPPDLIAGILASWIEHSSEDLLDEDWFI